MPLQLKISPIRVGFYRSAILIGPARARIDFLPQLSMWDTSSTPAFARPPSGLIQVHGLVNHVHRSLFDLLEHASHVFADDAQREERHAVQKENGEDRGSP